MKPVIFGLEGQAVTAEERALFRDSDPLGYVLFKRNCDNRDQLRALTDDLREISGRADVPILIDQEGGRVTRMQPPEWPAFPPQGDFDRLYDISPIAAIEAAKANAYAIGLTLAEVGINVDALPLLDVRQPDADNIMGDRTFGTDPMRVAALGRAVIDGLAEAGVVGIIKHIPGHGRAKVDSHKELPVVDASAHELEHDIEPFRTLRHAPMGMTAHVIYRAWDAERPGTLSPTVINDVIRGKIGFEGLLMTDDIDMKALSGTAGEKAAQALAAGCDVALDCWGRMDEMKDIVESIDEAPSETLERLQRAMASVSPQTACDRAEKVFEALARRDALIEAMA